MSEPEAFHQIESRRLARWRLLRTALAILLAPALGGAIFGMAVALYEFGQVRALETMFIGAMFGAVIGASLGLPLIGTVGLLFYWVAQKRGWTRWWHYILGGAVAGMLGLAFVALYDLAISPSGLLSPNFWIRLFEFVGGGILVGGFAWLIRRPDWDLRDEHDAADPAP